MVEEMKDILFFSPSHLVQIWGPTVILFLVITFLKQVLSICFNRCTVHFDIYKVHTPTNALFIKLDKVLNFTLKIISICSSAFRSLNTTIISQPSLEPS